MKINSPMGIVLSLFIVMCILNMKTDAGEDIHFGIATAPVDDAYFWSSPNLLAILRSPI